MSAMMENSPELWKQRLPRPASEAHKYQRGHAVIFAATDLTGATRLAAEACSRMGAGLVSVLATRRADIYRCTLPPDVMVSEDTVDGVRNPTSLLGGCGGLPAAQRNELYMRFEGCVRIFDANAIPGPSDRAVLDENSVLTPHDGEFEHAFPDISGDRETMAIEASKITGAVIVLKGSQTIIAAPDGRAAINTHATPWLAKAGTGDVLAGMIAGLTAQRMDLFEAACAAVWIHGEAGRQIGAGLIAGDIAGKLPPILGELLPGV